MDITNARRKMMSIEYNGKTYERVPEDAPELEYDLIERPVEPISEVPEVNLDVLPSSPPKLMRMHQVRYIDVLAYDEEIGKFVTIDRVLASSYVPYSWVPVLFYKDITWFREIVEN